MSTDLLAALLTRFDGTDVSHPLYVQKLVELGYLRQVGGEFPYVVTTPKTASLVRDLLVFLQGVSRD